MPARSNQFQRLITAIQRHFDPVAEVTESAMLIDRQTKTEREVDVCVRGQLSGQQVVVSVECRDRGRPADISWVDEMKSKHSRLSTDVLVLVSHSGFTAEAIRIAESYGIRHFSLDDVDPTAPERLFPDVESLWGKTWALPFSGANSPFAAWRGLQACRTLGVE